MNSDAASSTSKMRKDFERVDGGGIRFAAATKEWGKKEGVPMRFFFVFPRVLCGKSTFTLHHFAALPQERRHIKILRLIARRG